MSYFFFSGLEEEEEDNIKGPTSKEEDKRGKR